MTTPKFNNQIHDMTPEEFAEYQKHHPEKCYKPYHEQDILEKLRIRAEIRRQIPGRKSVQEGKSDRLADLLEEAAKEIERLRQEVRRLEGIREDR